MASLLALLEQEEGQNEVMNYKDLEYIKGAN